MLLDPQKQKRQTYIDYLYVASFSQCKMCKLQFKFLPFERHFYGTATSRLLLLSQWFSDTLHFNSKQIKVDTNILSLLSSSIGKPRLK